MIPDIHAIVEMLIAGQCTAQQAIGWINTHMENADLRDHFAGKALEALVHNRTPDDAATEAYEYADAMLQARAL